MDIDYLLMLQNFRENVLGGTFNDLGTFISDFIVAPWMLMFFCIVMWNFSKKDGFYFFLTYSLGEVVNAMIKLTACVYRPWISDERVLPARDSKTHATGYSFPSGHSLTAMCTYGTLAKWQWSKRKWISIICIVLIAVTMFSRNFLGVHFPQDVLVGAGHGFIILLICIPFSKWLEKCDGKKEIFVLIGGLLIAALMILYIEFKPYPLDYVDGKLLVDPAKITEDGFAAIGMFVGLTIGWFIEHRWIKFECFNNKKIGIPISVVAVVPIYFWRQNIKAFLSPFIGPWMGGFILRFMEYMYALVIIPLIINIVNKKTKERDV